MKKMLFFIIISFFITSCATHKDIKDNTVKENLKIPSTGWIDKDTYTVRAVSSDLDSAIDQAKHQILQNIVKTRMMNESKYTDITKISGEFEKPMKMGTVILKKQTSLGIEIFFQIREKNLRQKFERK